MGHPRERSIGFENECDSFLQIGAGFFQGSALGVRAGKLLDEGNVAFRNTAVN